MNDMTYKNLSIRELKIFWSGAIIGAVLMALCVMALLEIP